jgi:Ribbon-helix-helix protein, copG family
MAGLGIHLVYAYTKRPRGERRELQEIPMRTGRKVVAEMQPLRKKCVLSVRVTEGEMGQIQKLMDNNRMSASQLIREALLNYRGTGAETGALRLEPRRASAAPQR